jgi:hypothetical protein
MPKSSEEASFRLFTKNLRQELIQNGLVLIKPDEIQGF